MRISNKIFAIVVPTMTLMMMAMGAVNYKLVRDEQRESSEQFQNELGVKSSREITKSLASVRLHGWLSSPWCAAWNGTP